MSEPSLALVVVTHNSQRWLPDFFSTWRATLEGLARPLRVRVLIADAGSTPDQVAGLSALAPAATILKLANIGYGAAANRAAAAADTSHLLLCNPDLTFPKEFARRLLAPLLDGAPHAAACLAPRLLNADGSLQPSVGGFPTLAGLLRDQFRPREHRKYLHPQPATAQKIDWAMAACLLVRKDAYDAVGGFDERFFLYVEEVDLLRRLHDAGHATWFLPDVSVMHHQPNANRAPRPEVQRYAARGLLRYFAKHGTTLQRTTYGLLALASRRLPAREALASRAAILKRSTGP
jgi:GT2 family glycosyltransferase